MMSLLGQLELLFEEAVGSAYPHLVDPPLMVTPSTKSGFGDYQCNSAMALAKVIYRLVLFKLLLELGRAVIFTSTLLSNRYPFQ